MFPNSVASATITLYKIEEVSLYQSELLSSNGTIFHPYDTSTTLTFRVYRGIEDITSSIEKIEWVRYSYDSNLYFEDKAWGTPYENNSCITISKDEINKKCIIQANAYMKVKNKDECIASSRTTLIDVNELYSANEPPENPIDGQLWVDTSKKIPVINSWNSISNRWTVVGQTTPFVRNLIQNSNFWKLNTTNYNIENAEYLKNLIVIENMNKKWLRLMSSKPTETLEKTAGVYQNTDYPIEKESNYVFSLLAYCVNENTYQGSCIYIKISSIDENNELTTLFNKVISIYDEECAAITCGFTTLSNTNKIQVLIGVDPQFYSEFYITELSLYNTSNYYPWELSPEDTQEIIDNKLNNDHLSVFNALTRNGTMEGIYIDTDENGIEHYYFNASHMKSGSIDGGLINGIGLNIKDKDGQSIFHVYEDEDGQTHIDMIANNLYIGNKEVSTEEHVLNSISASEATTYAKIETDISESEKSTKQYVDEALSDLSDSTGSLIENSIADSKEIMDKELNDQITLLNKKIEEHKKESSDRINDIISDHESDLETLHETISKEIDADVSTAKTSTIDYIDNIKKVLQEQIDAKADSDGTDTLGSRVTKVENDLNDLSDIVETKADKTSITNINKDIAELKSSKVSKTEIITNINNSSETKLIDIKKVDVSSLTNSIDTKVDSAKIIEFVNSSKEELKINEDKLTLTNLMKTIEDLSKRVEELEKQVEELKTETPETDPTDPEDPKPEEPTEPTDPEEPDSGEPTDPEDPTESGDNTGETPKE